MLTTIILFISGILLYSFVEYAVHRWLLHGPMKKQHIEHHRYPAKHQRTPFVVVAPVLVLVFLAFGPALAVGMFVCWLGSAVLHHRLHTSKPTSVWVRKLQKHHITHHRQASTNFGVSTVVWDKLFGTIKLPA